MANTITRRKLHALLEYEPDTGIFSWRVKPKNRPIKPGDRAGYTGRKGYRWVTIDGRMYQEHRLAYFYMKGRWPKQMDHKNGDKGDNRWDNLRVATNSQNQANKRLNQQNTSGYKGVTPRQFVSGIRYIAQISHQKKVLHIGVFDTPELAHSAYCREGKRLHGQFFNGG